MKTKILIFLFIHLAVFNFSASNAHTKSEILQKPKDTDANVTGHVVDKKTHEHLPYVSISLKGTKIQTYTDATGHYFMKNLPVRKYTLVAIVVG